jgi:hypothetical protein
VKRKTKQYEIRFKRYERRTRPGIPNGEPRKKLVKQADYAGDNSKDIVEVLHLITGGFDYANLFRGKKEEERRK